MPNDAHAARTDRPRGFVAAPGVILGEKYRLEEAIARGGMARVWRARHMDLNRPVAVKFVDGAGAGASGIERFLIEAKVAASVRHKNVVDIIDFGFVEPADGDPEPYMVMELLEGETLGERIERSPLSDDESVDIALQLLSGLDAVHRAGIIHRDLKPGNLFLTHDHDGTFARLLDFGISEGAEPSSSRDSGLVVGTPEYMSPEQAFGAAIDLRADLYGVGVMLYEMLSGGRLPFEHEEAPRVLEMVVAGVHTPLRTLRPTLIDLSAVVERALAKNPDDRYKNARDMRRAILEASGGADTTTERMAAIRESGTRKRAQAVTAPELEAPSLPAGSPLIQVPLAAYPTPSPARSQRAPLVAIALVALAVAGAGGAWAVLGGADDATAPAANEAAASDRVAPEATNEREAVEPAPIEAVVADEAAAGVAATAEEAVPNEALPNEAVASEVAANEVVPSDVAPNDVAGGDAAELAEVATGAEDAAASAPAVADETASSGRASRRRARREATEGEDAEGAATPADPPRTVVRDLDF